MAQVSKLFDKIRQWVGGLLTPPPQPALQPVPIRAPRGRRR